ncbi:cupin domain-containing protein [Streptomyces sp. HF10]|uniref:cupin domain-containing protein n=1 Tax=Streptomyces sp. HF10 TaxID=2692233 RepID=UPI001319314D|nr:cupin domain-containing protein [Streptomyces sp. HF10]QHC28701.1 cupin domain-containing protein [Streptomyces sp. HF10]
MTAVTKIAVSTVAPSHRQGGSTRALLTPSSVGATSGFLGHIELAPQESITEHYHPFSDKYLYLIEGAVVIRVNGAEVGLERDEALFVTRGQRHRIENRGNVPARLVFQIAPLAPRPELGHVDTEPVPDPQSAPPKVGG